MKITQSNIVEKTCCIDAEKRLFKSVMRKIGDWESILKNPEKYRNSSKNVRGFIYYDDTNKFAKKHLADILIILNKFENECGVIKNLKAAHPEIFITEEVLFDWYACFALEYCIQKIIDYKEGVYA